MQALKWSLLSIPAVAGFSLVMQQVPQNPSENNVLIHKDIHLPPPSHK